MKEKMSENLIKVCVAVYKKLLKKYKLNIPADDAKSEAVCLALTLYKKSTHRFPAQFVSFFKLHAQGIVKSKKAKSITVLKNKNKLKQNLFGRGECFNIYNTEFKNTTTISFASQKTFLMEKYLGELTSLCAILPGFISSVSKSKNKIINKNPYQLFINTATRLANGNKRKLNAALKIINYIFWQADLAAGMAD